MKESRVKNTFFNVFASLFEYFLKIVLLFITRTIFIRKLGAEYLGLDGLFTNILSILSISELGLNSAIVFSLYKPLANNDTKKINVIMNLYKKCYLFIGGFIFILGIILLPFLPRIVNSTFNFGNIYFIFLLYIIQTVSTYWVLAYKEAIIIADQKKYKLVVANNSIIVIKFALQLISLILFNSFIMYTISGIICNILKNIFVAYVVNKKYPYIIKYNGGKLDKEEKNSLIKNVFGTSLYKISSTVMNSTDNIIISSFISLTVTGLYSNYLLIVSNIKIIITTIFNSSIASIGNLVVSESKEKSEYIFRCLNFLCFWFYGFAAICLWELLNPFITLWLGVDYTFSSIVVAVIVLNFITDGLQHAVILYKDACGLFWKGKFRPVFSAITNIIISVILVKPLGITGVILGSILSRMITTWWFDPYLVYRHIFEMSVFKYYYRYFRSLIIIIISALLIDGITYFININIFGIFLIKALLCVIIPNMIFYILFRKSEEFSYLIGIILRKLKKKTA